MQHLYVQSNRRLSSLCVIAVALHASACATEEPDGVPEAAVAAAIADEAETGAAFRTLTLPSAPEHQLEIRVRHLGEFSHGDTMPDLEAEIGSAGRTRDVIGDLTERPPSGETADKTISWVGFRGVDDEHFELELWQASSAALASFGQAAQDSGATRGRHGSLPVTDVEDAWSARTWSDGVDTRTRRAIADGFSANIWPFRTIGRMLRNGASPGNGCTGTLIGQRTVLTAAHCVYSRSSGSFVSNRFFSPRRDSGATPNPHGTSDFEPALTPGAGETAVWLPAEYMLANCGGVNCNAWDIAVIELEDNLGDLVGGMGYSHIDAATLEGYGNLMRGYPSCSSTNSWSPSRPDDDPVTAGIQCTEDALYGDTQLCDIYSMPAGTFDCWGDGWHCELDITCDGSPGMSGSGVYTYDAPWAGGNPVIFGVYSQYKCVPGDPINPCTDPSENVITRITPTSGGFIAAFKAANGSW